MTLAVQAFLRSGGTLADLLSRYGVKSKPHPSLPITLLIYDQIASKPIEQIVRECRGLILEDGTWNVVNQSLLRFGNVGESWTDPIDWSTARVQEKVDGCYLHDQSIALWGGGRTTMGRIYNGERPILIGVDAAGRLVPSRVTNAMRNGVKDNWIDILHAVRDKKPCRMRVTSNHHVMIDGNYVPASEVRVGDVMSKCVPAPSKFARHMIQASLLGDGSISPVAAGSFKWSEGHKADHSGYTDELMRWLGPFATAQRCVTSGYGTRMIQVAGRATACLRDLREQWYEEDGSRKIPEDLTWIDDFAVAKWFMDDGSLQHSELQQDRACFATNRFREADVRRLAARLDEMYGVSATVYDSKGWCIRVKAGRAGQIDEMWRRIAPHVVPCMRYKLPARYRDVAYEPGPAGELAYETVPSVVTSVAPVELTAKNFPFGRVGFDIETTTHNYFAGNTLVHNSLAQVFSYDGRWHVATKGTPDAGGDVNGYGITFRQYFWDTFSKYVDALPDPDEGRCYWFELSGPMNRVVVRHPEPHLTLLGTRDLKTGQEIRLEDVAAFPSIPRVKEYPLKNIDEIAATFPSLSPLSHEGYVVVDAQWRRLKIKNPAYIALHRVAGNGRMSPKRALELVRIGETSEVLSAFPEYAGIVNEVRKSYEAMLADTESAWLSSKDIPSQKDFALEISGFPGKHALFAVRNGKAPSIGDYFRNARLDMVLDLLGYQDEPEAEAAQ